MRPIDRLAAAVERGTLPGLVLTGVGTVSELERALNARDEASFEQSWLAAFEAVERIAPLSQLSPHDRATVDRIREQTYKAAFAATGSPDLAGYVSDDFDLLARAILIAHESPWLAALLQAYGNGQFPGGLTLPAVNEPLSVVVGRL